MTKRKETFPSPRFDRVLEVFHAKKFKTRLVSNTPEAKSAVLTTRGKYHGHHIATSFFSPDEGRERLHTNTALMTELKITPPSTS